MSGLLEIFPPQPFEPAPYGILSLRDPDVTADERWLSGFTYESRLCAAEVKILDICGGAAPVSVIQPSNTPRNRDYTPFVIEATDRCSTFGFLQHDIEKRAIDALEACTAKALEYEFWTGAAATTNGYTANRRLASTNSTDVTPAGGAAVKLRYGLALLEGALATCGCGTKGTIHATRETASALPVKVVDEHLETQLGNYVIAGAGYTGSGPTGTMPASGVWMYATGPISVLLGESTAVGEKLKQQVNRDVNTWEARAQRPAAVTWDGCCAFAVHIDLALDYA